MIGKVLPSVHRKYMLYFSLPTKVYCYLLAIIGKVVLPSVHRKYAGLLITKGMILPKI